MLIQGFDVNDHVYSKCLCPHGAYIHSWQCLFKCSCAKGAFEGYWQCLCVEGAYDVLTMFTQVFMCY